MTTGRLTSDSSLLYAALEDEKKWQKSTKRLVRQEVQSIDGPIAWAAFHSSAYAPRNFYVTITSLLPLFPDDFLRAVEHMNPVDRFLYSQWINLCLRLRLFVVLLGGLHIEMATLATVGDLLDGSGWTNVLTQAGITTPGTAASFLKGAHIKRTRHAHQVTCSALSIMLRTAYDGYCLDTSEPLPFDDWCVKQVEASPQFHYWYMVIHLECLMLVFVRSIREGNFALYIIALRALAPWFFALDHTHYSRWVPVHIRDITTLHERLPGVAKEFDRGNKCTSRPVLSQP